MTDTAKQEAAARIAAAQAELAAAEEAYRQLVPCPHPSITITHPDTIRCGDCGVDLPDPRGCRHPRIDNDTRRCRECGEEMLPRVRRQLVTVRSAPNAAACTIPDCDGGPGCENPDGLYVPDESKAVDVPVRYELSYMCARCHNHGDMFEVGKPPVWDCGHNHRGDDIPIRKD